MTKESRPLSPIHSRYDANEALPKDGVELEGISIIKIPSFTKLSPICYRVLQIVSGKNKTPKPDRPTSPAISHFDSDESRFLSANSKSEFENDHTLKRNTSFSKDTDLRRLVTCGATTSK